MTCTTHTDIFRILDKMGGDAYTSAARDRRNKDSEIKGIKLEWLYTSRQTGT